MNNTGDGIYIEGGFDNDQINGAIEETLKRVQGLSDGTASAGASMDSTFNDIQQKVTTALNTIDKNIEFNKNEIKNLQAQYKTLGAEMKAALASGNTSLAKDKQAAIQAIDREIAALANENKELERSKQKVAETAQAWADNQKKQNENAQAHVTLRQRIKEVKEEMQNLVNQAQIEGRQVDENTGRYAELRAELGRLTDIQSDVAQQAKILANDEAQIAGVINGLSGLSGGLSAATGAVSLFAGENENLQKVMTKLQSVMAITMGLQQLQQTLNKDSAFRLTTLASIKQWWGKVEAEANAKAAASTAVDTAAKKANTAAQAENAAAKTANKVATDANTTSEIGNAGATELAGKAAVKSAGFFRVLGTAIKSVPGIGWLIAGATALIAVAGKLIGKEKERRQAALDSAKAIKEAQEEERKEINKTASDNIAKIEELSRRYKQLGNNFNEQKKFIDANKEAFRSLGVEITTVNDATQLLIDKKDEYVRAQLEYAKADVYRQRAKKLFEENADLLDTYDAIAARQHDKVPIYGPNGATMVEWDTRSEGDKIIQQQLEYGAKRIRQEIDELFDKAFRAETIADDLTSGFKKATTTVSNQVATSTEETLKKQLSAIKERYEQFYAWVNSSDKGARDAARTEFADLVEQGSTYLEFLKRKRDELTAAIAGGTATNEQAEQMRVLNDQIAQETKETVLSQFEAQLQSEMQGAQSLIEMLEIIKRKREEVTQQSTGNAEIDDEQQRILNDVERETNEKIAQRTSSLLEEYRSFNDRLVALGDAYNNDVAILERAYAEAKTDEEKKRIEDALAARRKAYDNARQGILDSEAKTLAESSDAYLALFNVASGASKRMLKQVLADAQAVLRAVKGEVVELPAGISQELIDKLKQSPEELQELYRQVFDLQEQVNRESGYPFASLVQGFKELKTSAELAAKAEQEVDEKAKKATADMANVTRDKALQSLASGAAEAFSKIGELGDSLEELGKSVEDSQLSEIGGMLSEIGSLASSIMQGAAAGGWIGALISGALSILSEIVDIESKSKQFAHESTVNAMEFNDAIRLLNLQLKDIYDNGFGVKAFEKIADAARIARESLAAMYDEINAQRDPFTGKRTNEVTFRFGYDSLNGDVTAYDLSKLAFTEDDYGWFARNILGKENKYKTIADVAPGFLNEDGSINPEVAQKFLDTYGKYLDDGQREAIQNAINLKLAYDAAIEEIGEAAVEMFGYLGDEARNSLVDAIVNGGDAWDSWKQKGSKAIEALGEELMYELFLATQFDNFKERIKKIYQDNAENPEEAARLAGEAMSQFFDEAHASMDAAQAWGKEWQRYWKEKGFDIWSNDDESANSFYGAARTVTETTASLIHGQMNAMRVNQVSQGDILRQQLLMLSSIKSDTTYLRSIDNRLRNIESRTSGTQYAARINH